MTIIGTGLSWWGDAVNDWDTLVLGGETWPGIATVTGSGVARKLDVKRKKGADVGTLKDEGYINGKLSIELRIWTQDQWRELQRLLPIIHPRRKGGDRKPLQIIHPVANLLGIENVYTEKLPIPSLDKGKGIMVFSFDVIEWTDVAKEVKNASGTGQASRKPLTDDQLRRRGLPPNPADPPLPDYAEDAFNAASDALQDVSESGADALNDLGNFLNPFSS